MGGILTIAIVAVQFGCERAIFVKDYGVVLWVRYLYRGALVAVGIASFPGPGLVDQVRIRDMLEAVKKGTALTGSSISVSSTPIASPATT